MSDAVTSVLDEMGLAWKRREEEYIILPSPGVPCEIVLSVGEDVLVTATLASWEEIGEEEARALDLFLHRAQSELPSVRLKREDTQATVEAHVSLTDFDAHLPDGIACVLMATRLLSRETMALLRPEVARAFEQFQTEESEIVAHSDRM
jgi:hypothetical protein